MTIPLKNKAAVQYSQADWAILPSNRPEKSCWRVISPLVSAFQPNKSKKSILSRKKVQKPAKKGAFSGKNYVLNNLLSKKILCRVKLHIFGIGRSRAFRWCPACEKKIGPKGAYWQKCEKRVLETVFSKKSRSNFFFFSISKYGSRDTVWAQAGRKSISEKKVIGLWSQKNGPWKSAIYRMKTSTRLFSHF